MIIKKTVLDGNYVRQQSTNDQTNNTDSNNNNNNNDNITNNNTQQKIIEVTNIKINKDKISIGEGQSETLVVTITPSNATNKTITWASSNNSIATVKNGVVTGVKEGEVTITATSGGKKTTTKVKVLGDKIHFVRTTTGRYGNTIVIESQGEYAIFDASGLDNQGVVTDAYLANIGITTSTPIKYAIISHLHEDHAEYMDQIILKYNVKNIIYKDYDCKCDSADEKDRCKTTLNGKITDYGRYKAILSAVSKKGVNRVTLGGKDGSKKLKVGNFTLSFYNVSDRLCYGNNKNRVSLNADSLSMVLTIKKGNKEMLTYLAGDLKNGKYEEETTVANKVAKDYNYKTFDVYQAAHHGYNEGIANTKFYFKYPILTQSIGGFCERQTDPDKGNKKAPNIVVIYNHMKNNDKLYFSNARSIQVNYTNSGVVINGGETMTCSDKTCKDETKAYNLLTKSVALKCKRYVLGD